MIIGLGVTVKVGLLTRQFSLHQGIGVLLINGASLQAAKVPPIL